MVQHPLRLSPMVLDIHGSENAGNTGRKKTSRRLVCYGAENRNRTCDPLITNEMLYQLSYFGMEQFYDFWAF
jgi:hypothetical protein